MQTMTFITLLLLPNK